MIIVVIAHKVAKKIVKSQHCWVESNECEDQYYVEMNFADLKPPPAGRGKEKGVAAEGQKSETRREGRMGAGNSAKCG